MDTKKYVIFDISEIDYINFDEVLENDRDSLRISNDYKTFVKYRGDMPTSVKSLLTRSKEYNNEEILSILEQENWNFSNSISGTTI